MKKIYNWFLSAVVLFLAVLFVVRFAGGELLKMYIQAGMGNCTQEPILCMAPVGSVADPVIDSEYVKGLITYRLPHIEIMIPKGFDVVRELVKKVYYKRHKKPSGSIVYLISQDKDFFVIRYPQLKSMGIYNDYEFIKRIMYARFDTVKKIEDAFLLIMKGIFIPDLGNQNNVVMLEIKFGTMRGFINYNLSKPDNYFQCDLVSGDGEYFKIYIKDKGAKLDLPKFFAIISTVKKPRY